MGDVMINTEKFGNYDYDSSKWVWDNVYNPMCREIWGEHLGEEFELENVTPKIFVAKHGDIQIRGDVIFNFEGYNGKPYINPKNKIITEEELKKYNAMRYSALNFSLIPRYGKLQNVKQGGRRGDRLDVYLYYLSEFYSHEDERILNYAKEQEDKDNLKNYLNSIGSIKEYFKKFYFMEDNDILEKLVECGGRFGNEDSEKNRTTYLELVKEFWSIRKAGLAKKGLKIELLDDGYKGMEVLQER